MAEIIQFTDLLNKNKTEFIDSVVITEGLKEGAIIKSSNPQNNNLAFVVLDGDEHIKELGLAYLNQDIYISTGLFAPVNIGDTFDFNEQLEELLAMVEHEIFVMPTPSIEIDFSHIDFTDQSLTMLGIIDEQSMRLTLEPQIGEMMLEDTIKEVESEAQLSMFIQYNGYYNPLIHLYKVIQDRKGTIN